MSRKQQILIKRHGTVQQFGQALNGARISVMNARWAFIDYEKEFREAELFWEPEGSEKYFPAAIIAQKWRADRKFARVGLTNGCFDIIHAGHVQYLRECRAQCDYLIVLLNSNESVRKLKGEGRPINHQHHRAYVMTGFEMVDAVMIFSESRITKWLRRLKPDIWFKGGDYTLRTLNREEVKAAKSVGCKIKIIPQKSVLSTTKIYEKMGHVKEMDKGHRPPKARSGKLQGSRKS